MIVENLKSTTYERTSRRTTGAPSPFVNLRESYRNRERGFDDVLRSSEGESYAAGGLETRPKHRCYGGEYDSPEVH